MFFNKRIVIVLFALALSVSAQIKQVGPAKVVGPAYENTINLQNVIGPVDFLTDLSCTTPGTAITAAILNTAACTHGIGNTGNWAVSGTGTVVAAHVSNCALGGVPYVNAFPYSTNNPSLSFSFDNTTTLNIATIGVPTVGYFQGTFITCFTPTVGAITGVMDWFRINGQAGGAFALLQISTSNCAGSVLGVDLETNPGGVAGATACISVTSGNSIWAIVNWDGIGGNAQANLYDSSFNQIGSTLTRAITATDLASLIIGNDQSGTTTGVNKQENVMADWTAGAAFPVGPKTTTQVSPVYFVSKTFNTTALSGAATTTVSPAINLLAGQTNVVWNSYENAAGTTSGCVDTAGNTYTQATTVTLATQGHGEIWTAKNTIANPANVVTCTHTSSTFRNIFVTAVAGASLTAPVDVSAVGTAAAGNANVTTGPFTPTTSTGSVIACGYITAGVALTPGTNYYQINTSTTTSAACEFRPNAPNSSQTASLTQANTSSKWMIAVALKQ